MWHTIMHAPQNILASFSFRDLIGWIIFHCFGQEKGLRERHKVYKVFLCAIRFSIGDNGLIFLVIFSILPLILIFIHGIKFLVLK